MELRISNWNRHAAGILKTSILILERMIYWMVEERFWKSEKAKVNGNRRKLD